MASIISLIAAVASNGVIGSGNQLPWRLPADLAHFKQLTMGKPMLMGRRTWDSIGKALPGRISLVLSRDAALSLPATVRRFSSLAEVLAAQVVVESEELMVIGGAQVYRQTLPIATRIYLTLVHQDFAGDVRFPDLDRNDWRQAQRADHPADARNPWPYSFILYQRNGGTRLNQTPS